MKNKKPEFLKMIRAPFLSSIIGPILIGSLLASYVTGNFLLINFFIVIIMGIFLHIATNVYNDIFDTLQGTDKINANRNEFSGGSGILVKYPELMPEMYQIARISLIIALLACLMLVFRINQNLRIFLVSLFLISAFYSKYYTAAPIKCAYRGWGEISVWFAFGPMAILVAAVSQNLGFHQIIVIAMPITGLSTLSILLIGQMIDLKADRASGKWGVAVRFGNRAAVIIYFFVQIFLITNFLFLFIKIFILHYLPLLSLLPYLFLLPMILKILFLNIEQVELLKKAARLNVLLHLSFYFLLVFSLVLIRFI